MPDEFTIAGSLSHPCFDKALVIGYGNPMRGDDGIGWRAIEALGGQVDPAAVRLETCHQLTPEWSDPISRARRVIFIDAACDAAPGDVRCRTLSPVAEGHPQTHRCDPAWLLACAVELFGRCPPAHLLTVGGEDFSLREDLSATVASALPRIVARVQALLEADEAEAPPVKPVVPEIDRA